MTAAPDLDRWAFAATSAEYTNALVLAFNDAGWGWQVSAAIRSGGRSFRAGRDGVGVWSDTAGVRITVDGAVVREVPRGTPVEDVLAVAVAAIPDTRTED